MSTRNSVPINSARAIPSEKLSDAQQDLIVEVQYVLEAVLRDKKITRRELAARLGKSEATISRALDGDSNLTLKSIADIATALGDTFQVSSRHFERMKASRHVSSMYCTEPMFVMGGANMWENLGVGMIAALRDFSVDARSIPSSHKACPVATAGSAFVDVGDHAQHLAGGYVRRGYNLPTVPVEKRAEFDVLNCC